jgi:hypothetical protein
VNETAEAGHRRALREEAHQVERYAYLFSVAYRVELQWWRPANTALTSLAAVLAAVSGATSLASLASRTVTALMALAAAAEAAVAGALGGSDRAAAAQAGAVAALGLMDAARTYRRTVAPYVSLDLAVEKFDELCAHRDRVVATATGTHFRRPRVVDERDMVDDDPTQRD